MTGSQSCGPAYSPPKVSESMVACCILNNKAVRAGQHVKEHKDENDSGEEEEPSAPLTDVQEDEGRHVRQHIICYFQ